MKLKDLNDLSRMLNEMPILKNNELKISEPYEMFYSDQTIEEEFVVISVKGDVRAVMHQDMSFAAIGVNKDRSDGTPGIEVVGLLDFKDGLDLGFNVNDKRYIQVDLAQTRTLLKRAGMMTELYMAVANYGFILVSDTEQYLGGQAIWKKLAKVAHLYHCEVNVVEKGNFISQNGDLVKYNGSNISDDVLWSEDAAKKHTLFILRRV